MFTSSSNPFSFGMDVIHDLQKQKKLRQWKRYYDQRQIPHQMEIRTHIDKALSSRYPSQVQTMLTGIKHLVFRYFYRRVHYFFKLFMQNKLSVDNEEANKIFQLILDADSIPDSLFYEEMERYYRTYRSTLVHKKPRIKYEDEDEDEIRLDKLKKLLSFKLSLCEIIAHSPKLWKASEILYFMITPTYKDDQAFLLRIKQLLDSEILEWYQKQPPTMVEQYKRYLYHHYNIPEAVIDRVSKQFIVSPQALRNFFLLN